MAQYKSLTYLSQSNDKKFDDEHSLVSTRVPSNTAKE